MTSSSVSAERLATSMTWPMGVPSHDSTSVPGSGSGPLHMPANIRRLTLPRYSLRATTSWPG